jgi:hypothetical protein
MAARFKPLIARYKVKQLPPHANSWNGEELVGQIITAVNQGWCLEFWTSSGRRVHLFIGELKALSDYAESLLEPFS